MSDSTPSHRDSRGSGSHYQPSLGVVFVIVIVFIAATFAMVSTLSSSSSTGTTTTTLPTTTTTKPAAAAPVIKSKTSVQVANGTNVTNLAANYTQRLTIQDWDTQSPENGPAEAKTVIYYKPGELKAAQEVATTLGVKLTAIKPVGSLVPVTGGASDDVIVILGTDQKA